MPLREQSSGASRKVLLNSLGLQVDMGTQSESDMLMVRLPYMHTSPGLMYVLVNTWTEDRIWVL
jgi:hypothetical protein